MEDRVRYVNPEAPVPPETAYQGSYHEGCMPATLNLARRARLAINGMTEPTDPEADYRVYWKVAFRFNPPVMYHDISDTGITLKFMESVPRMRLMSGSKQGLQVEQRWKEALVRMIGPDGLVATPLEGLPYLRANRGKVGPFAGEQVIDVQVNGLALGVAATCAILDSREFWEPIGCEIVKGLCRLAVSEGDVAYLPKWWYEPGERADPWLSRPRGAAANTVMWPARRLVDFYRVTGYEPALDLAGQFCRYMIREAEYFGPSFEFLRDDLDPQGARYGVNHFHHHAMAILTILEYALASDDQEALDFVLGAFPVAKTYGDCLTGFFPESVLPERQTCELCEVGDMVRIAVRLAGAGLGDHYWDDADRWVRNHLAEGQFLRYDWIYRLHFGDPQSDIDVDGNWPMTTERVGERNLGAFGGWLSPNDWIEFALTRWDPKSPKLQRLGHIQGIMHCCTANATRALYDVWRNITHAKNSRVKVNLLLNYSDEEVDIDSHIPYVGKVEIRTKRYCDLAVRIPAWVDLEQVECKVNGTQRRVIYADRYVQIGHVPASHVVSLAFPMAEQTDRVTIGHRWYSLVRKGHDVVSIDPPGRLCPLYQRDHYRDHVTLWRKATRYVASQELTW